MKQYIKKRLSFLLPLALVPEYLQDYVRYVKHSGMLLFLKGENQLLGRIIQEYHVLEKGLTMPETRFGFGVERLISLVQVCNVYISKYGKDDEQLQHALSVICEYKKFHQINKYDLPQKAIDSLNMLGDVCVNIKASEQIKTMPSDYFSQINGSFPEFSNSRRSIRNYSEEDIPLQLIEKAVDLARNAPSSCNKQGSRVHVYTKPELISGILGIQTGNRGFGQLANKLIVVTGELGFSYNVYERNQVYVDGGIFSMNLLYALHHNKIAGCPLNCYLSHAKEKKIKEIGGIPDSEVLVMMISCGYLPDEFQVALSPRYALDTIMNVN